MQTKLVALSVFIRIHTSLFFICLMLFEQKKDEEEQKGEEAHAVTQGISHPQDLLQTLVLNLK